jgi:hypothetical protein
MKAAYRPFWYDELITWHIARLPDWGKILATLRDGADQEPPLLHLVVRTSHSLFGPGLLATRLPALIGFWVLMLGIFLFLKRRVPLPYALIGMTFPMLTYAWPYAFEARAYGAVLGCEAAALVAWQNVADGRWRRLSLAVLAISMALGMASHPVFVLIAVPLALGEGVRTYERKRFDLPVWLAFAAAGLALLSYPGSISTARDWELKGLQTGLTGLPDFYDNVFRSAIAPLLFAGLAVILLVRREPGKMAPGPLLPRHEAAALLGSVVAPAAFFAAGMVTHGFIFFTRYGLLCVIGVACGSAFVMYRATAGSYRAGMVILCVMVAWLTLARGREAISISREPETELASDKPLLIEALALGMPVVATEPLTFMAADFYLPKDAVGRLYYVATDRATARQYMGQDLTDNLVLRAARNLPLRAHTESLQDFTGQNSRFLLHGSGWYLCLYDVLVKRGWHLALHSHHGDEWVFEASAPGRQANASVIAPRQ